MGYRKTPTIYTLDEIPGEDGLVVRMKAIRFGRVRRLMTLLEQAEEDKNAAESITQLFDLLLEGLVSWNLEDEDGRPVPANVEGVEDQELGLLISILNCWLENMTGVDEDLGKGSSSGESFPGRPLTMEAL